MGKNLHHSIRPCIEKVIKTHSKVENVSDISNDDFFIYKVSRRNHMSDVIVLIADNYYFGEYDYHSIAQKELNGGGFILLARPEAQMDSDHVVHYKSEKIIIGKLKGLMGALNKDQFWLYTFPKKNDKKKAN